MTKIFTAAAIMQLVDRGEIALDTRVMPFIGIERTAISDDVTVFHCLTHTSGIADDADEEAGEDYEQLFVDKPTYSIRETRDFLPQFAYKEPIFPPGEGVRYNNVAYVLLGLVIEKATGMTYRDYVRQHIFAPAGMSGADFCAMDGTCENLAEHYKRVEHADGTVAWRKNIYSYPPIGSPDGGATVTAMDLDRFIRAIRAGTLMGAEASRQLLRPQVKRRDIDSGSLWNGLGFEFELGHDGEIVHLGKDGINAGVSSLVRFYPAQRHYRRHPRQHRVRRLGDAGRDPGCHPRGLAALGGCDEEHTLGHGCVPSRIHTGRVRYDGSVLLICQLMNEGMIDSTVVSELQAFDTAIQFARSKVIIPAPESAHAIRAGIDKAFAVRDAGEAKTVLIGIFNQRQLDMVAYRGTWPVICWTTSCPRRRSTVPSPSCRRSNKASPSGVIRAFEGASAQCGSSPRCLC